MCSLYIYIQIYVCSACCMCACVYIYTLICVCMSTYMLYLLWPNVLQCDLLGAVWSSRDWFYCAFVRHVRAYKHVCIDISQSLWQTTTSRFQACVNYPTHASEWLTHEGEQWRGGMEAIYRLEVVSTYSSHKAPLSPRVFWEPFTNYRLMRGFDGNEGFVWLFVLSSWLSVLSFLAQVSPDHGSVWCWRHHYGSSPPCQLSEADLTPSWLKQR